MRLQPGVDQFEHAERVGLAAKVGGRQPVRLVHVHREQPDVAQVPERPFDRVPFAHVLLFRHVLFVRRRVRDRVDRRRRAADRQQQVQHAAETGRRAAPVPVVRAAAAFAQFVFDFVRRLPVQLAQVDDGTIHARKITPHVLNISLYVFFLFFSGFLFFLYTRFILRDGKPVGIAPVNVFKPPSHPRPSHDDLKTFVLIPIVSVRRPELTSINENYIVDRLVRWSEKKKIANLKIIYTTILKL